MKFATCALVMAACASAISISDAKDEAMKKRMDRAQKAVDLFTAVDKNEDGVASKDEILAYAKSKGLSDEKAKKEAKKYGERLSKDGNVSWLEFKQHTGMNKLDLADILPEYLQTVDAATI